MDRLLQSYEDVPYPRALIYQTHPDALATAAFLAGLQPAPVENCRVLEIGCGTGANLLAMAAVLPDSRFLGVDLSPRQIAAGQELADELKLENVQLISGDLQELALEGEIDYLICHGVFSWCAPPVQERILRLCQEKLAPNGVAYISFNALPGWHKMGLWRELMMWGARDERLDWKSNMLRARRTLESVAAASEPIDPGYAKSVREGAEMIRDAPDAWVLHDLLEVHNEPFLFREVVRRAAAHRLQFLAESCRPLDLNMLPPAAQKWVSESARDRIEVEQCVDFVKNTSLRRSLFCRAALTVDEVGPDSIGELHMNGLCEPMVRDADTSSDDDLTFRTESGNLTTDIPLVKTVLVTLWRVWPRTLQLPELAARVREKLPDADEDEVADTALQCYRSGLLAMHVWAPKFAMSASEKPLAFALARAQSSHGLIPVTNLRHREVALNHYERTLLEKLDGTRDRKMLVEEMVQAAEAGRFEMEKGGQLVRGGEPMRALMMESIPAALQRLAHAALLIS
jgi:SAM-dependent methyltransferase/methyltransferase-like protein